MDNRFIQTVSTDEAKKECLYYFDKLGEFCTPTHSPIPFIEIGYIDNYRIFIRYSQTLKTPPSWSFLIKWYDTPMVQQNGFINIEDAIVGAVTQITTPQKKRYNQINDLHI